MDYILFNSDGSLNKKQIKGYIQQGSSGVNQIFVSVDSIDSYLYNAQAVFTLPNEQSNTLAGVPRDNVKIDGEYYNGWVFTLGLSQTRYDGLLVVAIRVIVDNNILVNFPFALVVNKTGVKPETDTGVTIEELDSYLLLLQREYVRYDEYEEQIAEQVATAVQDNTDDTLSTTSENPVQNKVVTAKLNELNEQMGFYKVPGDSTNRTFKSIWDIKGSASTQYYYLISLTGYPAILHFQSFDGSRFYGHVYYINSESYYFVGVDPTATIYSTLVNNSTKSEAITLLKKLSSTTTITQLRGNKKYFFTIDSDETVYLACSEIVPNLGTYRVQVIRLRDGERWTYSGSGSLTLSQLLTDTYKYNWALDRFVEKKANKVTSISASSTNDQYPSAKLLYDQLLLKTDKIGRLPLLSVGDTTTKVIDFINNNNCNGSTINIAIFKGGPYYHFIGYIYYISGGSLTFALIQTDTQTPCVYLGEITSNINDVTFGDITSNTYVKHYQMTDQKVTSISSASNNNQYPSAKAVWTLFQSIPAGMTYKGTVGVGGDVADLPAAAPSNNGWMYAVITPGTYQGIAFQVGDRAISNGTSWSNIPSGNSNGTVTSVGVSVPTGLQVSDTPVTTSGTIAITFASGYSIPTNAKQNEWDSKASPEDLNNRVPYTGATGNVYLGNHTLYTSSVDASSELAVRDDVNSNLLEIFPTYFQVTSQGHISTYALPAVQGAHQLATVYELSGKVDKNGPITGATKCKITYDSKGLVTYGTDLEPTDIPNLDASKITSGTLPDARISSAATWNAKQEALVSGSNIKTINGQSILRSSSSDPTDIQISVSATGLFLHTVRTTESNAGTLKIVTTSSEPLNTARKLGTATNAGAFINGEYIPSGIELTLKNHITEIYIILAPGSGARITIYYFSSDGTFSSKTWDGSETLSDTVEAI